jgi:hypothetical protein
MCDFRVDGFGCSRVCQRLNRRGVAKRLALPPRVSDSIARYSEEPCSSVLDTARRSICQDQL